MGKIKIKKHRIHSVAPKADIPTEDEKKLDLNSNQQIHFGEDKLVNNVFSNIFIPTSALRQQLPNFSSQRAIKAKHAQRNETLAIVASRLNYQKKSGNKREPVHKVVKSVLEEQAKKRKEKKKKAKAVLGSYDALKDALPALNELKKEIQEKPKAIKPMKTRALEMSENIQSFHNILQNPSFASNPFEAVSAYLRAHLSS